MWSRPWPCGWVKAHISAGTCQANLAACSGRRIASELAALALAASHHSLTGETQWEAPEGFGAEATADAGTAQAAGEWTAHVDEDSGATYYYNASTGETTWEMPAEMAAAATESTPASGGAVRGVFAPCTAVATPLLLHPAKANCAVGGPLQATPCSRWGAYCVLQRSGLCLPCCGLPCQHPVVARRCTS